MKNFNKKYIFPALFTLLLIIPFWCIVPTVINDPDSTNLTYFALVMGGLSVHGALIGLLYLGLKKQ